MATRNIVHTVTYLAWDTANNVGKISDNPSVNHTLKWVKDGALEAVDGTPAEVDATDAPGIYKVALTADETNCNIGVLCGKSSTAGITIVPLTIQFERLPDAAPAANGGLPTVDANNHINGVQDTLDVNVIQVSGDSTAADNLEAAYDGTGYAGGTTKLDVNVVQVSGDSTAADNLEAAYDGTGYAGGTTKLSVNVVQVSGDSTAADNLEAAYDGTGYGIQAASAATSVAVSSVTAAGLADIWTNDGTGLTESYATISTTQEPTPTQMLYMIFSCVSDFSITGATITSKQLNNSTAMTWTMNDATDPTSRTRAT